MQNMQKSSQSTKRQQGQSLTELVFSFVILGMGMLGIDAMDVSKDLRRTNAEHEELAMAIAVGQRDWIDTMPYSELRPTEGFEAPEWIQSPGLEPGAVFIETTTDRAESSRSPQIYSVKWQVEDADEWGSMRRIVVAVEWEKPNRELGRVVVKGLRAGMHAG
jgi:Tfp pilus assembly protein PilV